jgi:Fe-S cluster assembly ATPase SufC
MSPEDRAREGLFLAFQYRLKFRGFKYHFLRTALNEIVLIESCLIWMQKAF